MIFMFFFRIRVRWGSCRFGGCFGDGGCVVGIFDERIEVVGGGYVGIVDDGFFGGVVVVVVWVGGVREGEGEGSVGEEEEVKELYFYCFVGWYV